VNTGPLQYHRIILLRSPPGTATCRDALACARAWSEVPEEGALMVFFHGRGVEHAAGRCAACWRELSEWHRATLAVCSGSWARRFGTPPEPPFELSSLVTFWNQAADARQTVCFGESVPPAPQGCSDRVAATGSGRNKSGWKIVIASGPADPGSREILELVLAGATLELDLEVIFAGPGRAHLQDKFFAPFRQLTDHELARISVLGPQNVALPASVGIANPACLDEAAGQSPAGVFFL